LQKRGNLTLWFSDEAILAWDAPAGGKPGGQRVYSDLAIETVLIVRAVYHLGLRQTEGFLRSVSSLLGLKIRIPDYSTLSRRSMTSAPVQICPTGSEDPVHILIDSTGLKVHRGCAPRGKRNRRQWRKLHLVVDAVNGDILASELTTRRASDCAHVPSLLAEITRELASVMADGAYDTRRVYSTIEARPARSPTKILIPPRSNARSPPRSSQSTNSGDHIVQLIRELGIRRWRNSSAYMRRSLIEAAISRFKMIIGRRLRSRTMDSQRTESTIACRILNTMTKLGMPDSYCAE
jgi:transposase